MKKLLLIALCVMAVTVAAFAQNYTAQEITGRVDRDAGGGKWELIQAGDTIKAGTIIRTGIGAKLEVKFGEEILAVGPAKTGKIEELAGSSTATQLQGKVSQTDTSAVTRTSTNASTASARASDAAAGIEVAEE